MRLVWLRAEANKLWELQHVAVSVRTGQDVLSFDLLSFECNAAMTLHFGPDPRF